MENKEQWQTRVSHVRSFFADALEFDYSFSCRLREAVNLFSRFADYSTDGRSYPERLLVFEEIFGTSSVRVPVVITIAKAKGSGMFFSNGDPHRCLILEGVEEGFVESEPSLAIRIIMEGMSCKGPTFEGHPVLVLEERAMADVVVRGKRVTIRVRAGFEIELAPAAPGDERLVSEMRTYIKQK
jgi:hypothetical protein